MSRQDTQFKKGQTPWNKGLTGYMGANATSFKKGNTPPQQKPVGTISNQMKHGVVDSVCINIDWRGNRKPHNVYAWYVWELHNQQDRPKGMVIYHMDGDIHNNNIDNLEVISRAELLRRNRVVDHITTHSC